MAVCSTPPGNNGPVNEGERVVLERLRDELPDSFTLLYNLTLTLQHGQSAECDIIAIGPDCIWLIETKDLAGRVVAGEHEFRVDSELRTHPFIQTRTKAQKIKTRLGVHPNLGDVWVQPLVVLARKPALLQIDDAMKHGVVLLDRAVEILKNPTLVGLQKDKLPEAKRTLTVQRLGMDMKTRAGRERYGPYKAIEPHVKTANREWWVAEHVILHQRVLLEVVKIDPLQPKAEQDRLRNISYQAAKVRAQVGPHPYILSPENVLDAENGSVVVVHPYETASSLAELDPEIPKMTDAERRKIVYGVATALLFCHMRGVAHRMIGPSAIFVRPNGTTLLGGFGRALINAPGNMTVSPENWEALDGDFWMAPEQSAGAVGRVGQEADLFALGKLIEHLWPEGAPAGLAEAAVSLCATVPLDRKPTAKDVANIAVPPAAPAKAPEPAKPAGPPTPAPGVLLGDRYELVENLGSGGAGSVWRATDTLLGGDVALKIYKDLNDPTPLISEFNILRGKQHPSIVRVDYAVELDGLPVLISELLTGPNLRAVMESGGRMSLEVAGDITMQLLQALCFMHPNTARIAELRSVKKRTDDQERELQRLVDSGIVHRDIKPENIILTEDGRPVLVDFGLASKGTKGAVSGTAAYRPRDAALDSADPDIDLFAVGIILHELLTGKHPYTGGDPLTGELVIDASLDAEVNELLTRACSPQRDARYASAFEFVGALATLDIRIPEPLGGAASPLATVQRIEALMQALDWEAALAECPDEWAPLRAKIQRAWDASRDAAGEPALLEVDGYSIRFIGAEPFELLTSSEGKEVGPGITRRYLIEGPGGVFVEVHDHHADTGERWIQGGDAHQTPEPMNRLASGLRVTVTDAGGGNRYMELRQARLKKGELPNAFMAAAAELDSGAGVDVGTELLRFGSLAYGTRGETMGHTNNRRNQMSVVFAADNPDLPAVAHFLTKALPLAHGVEHRG